MDIGCTFGSGKIGVRPARRRDAIVEKPDCFASTIRSLTTFSAKNFFSSSLPAALGTLQGAVMEETRNRLRSAVLKRRSTLASSACRFWSHSIQAKVLELPQYLSAQSVAVYHAIGNEVETEAIVSDALGREKKVFCPKIRGDDSAVFVRIFSQTDLVRGRAGPAEPRGDVRLSKADCDGLIVIVPGVVFDDQGNRLGRGGGWYDRALKSFDDRAVFVGLAYEFQVIDKVPAASWDEKVHYVVTEARVIDCGMRRGDGSVGNTERGHRQWNKVY